MTFFFLPLSLMKFFHRGLVLEVKPPQDITPGGGLSFPARQHIDKEILKIIAKKFAVTIFIIKFAIGIENKQKPIYQI